MIELSLEYSNQLAQQSIFISALLCGFSLTVLVLLLDSKETSRLHNAMFRSATIATCAFIIGILAMTNILMKTTKGYPFEVVSSDLVVQRIVGGLMFYIGITSVIVIVSLSGWKKSKKMGWFTTIIATITFLFFLFLAT